MKTSQQIIELIRNDAPCVYDILNECCFPLLKGDYPHSGTKYTWDDYFDQNPHITRPTADQLLEKLHHYDGDNWDTHYWSGRYAQMLEPEELSYTDRPDFVTPSGKKIYMKCGLENKPTHLQFSAYRGAFVSAPKTSLNDVLYGERVDNQIVPGSGELKETSCTYTFPGVPPTSDDTIGRDKLDETMNAITKKYYGFTLVTCPECGAINARNDDRYIECKNGDCALMFRASSASDLFF